MKKCEFGHYYSDHLTTCPYCNPQANQGAEDLASTSGFIDNNKTAGFEGIETAVHNNDVNTDLPTRTAGDSDVPPPPISIPKTDLYASDNLDKTVIIEADSKNDDKEHIERPTRKLVGWLVSYTLDDMGYDFRIYEGKNVIGSNPGNEVSVLQDNSVSGKHATLLFRNNKFLLRDEFSTNGTYLNDIIVEKETPEIKDGDIIKVGNTIFKFKIAIF